LCTDGDFNVGTTDQSQLVELIEDKAQTGVFLTVLGFGQGNLKDSTMEKLADRGNGNYGYIDSLLEARKMLVEQIGGTLMTIAKDVKIQVDFNPQHVAAYRLVGYENRLLQNQDFRDDTKDAGEIGAGHTVTAFYELVPAGTVTQQSVSRPSEFVATEIAAGADSSTRLTVNLRYKLPDASRSQEFQARLSVGQFLRQPSPDFRFATAVLGYGMLLRGSRYAGSATWDWVVQTAEASMGDDPRGLRAEFVQLAKSARRIVEHD
jgi:Ca-activated chloride channel family protein